MAAKKEQTFEYINTTKANIYTEASRCGPDRVVMLTAKQAKQYSGLKKC